MHTIIGTRPWCASSTAGWKFAAAVPEVQSTTAGRPVARADPSAKNDADRSSRCTCRRMRSSAGERQRKRRRTRARREARVGDAVAHPLVDERAGEGGGRVAAHARMPPWTPSGGCWSAGSPRPRRVGPGAGGWRTPAARRAARDEFVEAATCSKRRLTVRHGAVAATTTYVGYSQGGRLCLQLALDRPDVVQRLVLVSASPGIADADARAARRRRRRAARAGDRTRRRRPVPRTLARATAVRDAAARAQRHRRAPQGQHRRLAHVPAARARPGRRSRRTGTGSASWRCPCSLIAGELDKKYVGIAHRDGRRRSTTRAWRSIAGAGHACHLEQPERRRSPARLPRQRNASSSGVGLDRAHRAASRRREPAGRTSRRPRASTRSRARTHTAARGARPPARRPAAMPTDVSIIEVTTAGTPAASATSSAARTPPSGCCLSTITSAASSARTRRCVVDRADALVGRDRHVDPPARRARGRRATPPVARRTRGRSARASRSCAPRCRRPTRRWRRPALRSTAPPRRAPRRRAPHSPASRTFTFTARDTRGARRPRTRRRPAR